MENKWWSYPQKIKNWTSNIDYVMFIDENGSTERVRDIYNKITNNAPIDENNKYFTITGCIFEKHSYSKARNNIRKLKEKYWNNGYYFSSKYNESRYVCLHSREIRRHDGAFNDKVINHNNFIMDLSKTLEDIDCKIISITIDLEKYVKKGYLQNVYEIAFDLLLERYIYATDNNKKGIIMLESRGKEEDKRLLKHINEIIFNKGRDKISTVELQEKICGVYFNPKWYSGHSSTFVGLEIADLFSYPIHQHIKYSRVKGAVKETLSFNIVKKKIHCYPNYENKGIKIFP